MDVLCSRYHVSLKAPGLSTGPCRVSNLPDLSKTQGGGGNLYLPWIRGEEERFVFGHFEMAARPDLSVIVARGPGVSPD